MSVAETNSDIDFGHPTGKIVDGQPQYAIEANLKGFLGAAYSLGAILSLPFVPYLNQLVGRRWTIMFGSCVSLVGALIQGFSNGGTAPLPCPFDVPL